MIIRVNVNDSIYFREADTVINAVNEVIIGEKIPPERIYHISGLITDLRELPKIA